MEASCWHSCCWQPLNLILLLQLLSHSTSTTTTKTKSTSRECKNTARGSANRSGNGSQSFMERGRNAKKTSSQPSSSLLFSFSSTTQQALPVGWDIKCCLLFSSISKPVLKLMLAHLSPSFYWKPVSCCSAFLFQSSKSSDCRHSQLMIPRCRPNECFGVYLLISAGANRQPRQPLYLSCRERHCLVGLNWLRSQICSK